MQMPKELDNNPKLISYIKTLTLLVGIICVILAGFVLLEMKSIIVPLVLALIISFILNPIILFFEKRHIPEFISIILVLTVTFCVLFLIAQLINLNIKSFLANIFRDSIWCTISLCPTSEFSCRFYSEFPTIPLTANKVKIFQSKMPKR